MKLFLEIPFFWLIPLIAASILITIWYYQKKSWVIDSPKWVRILLISLRSNILFILSVFIIGIVLELTSYKIEKPYLITLIDSSSSMLNYNDSSKIKNQIIDFQNTSKEKFGNTLNYATFLVDEKCNESKSINFKGIKSNLSNGFETILSSFYDRNIGGIVLISDGNYNEGSNPIYSSRKIPLTPIYTLGVGDTIEKPDQIIKQIFSNEIAFYRSSFPIEVTVEANKLANKNAVLSIYHNGKVVSKKNINYNRSNSQIVKLNFDIQASELGVQQYIAVIEYLKGEKTKSNNSKSIFVEVLDSRSKVLILSEAPHPDISALKSSLEKNKSLSIEVKNINNWKTDSLNADLIIWHNPESAFALKTIQKIQRSKLPVLYFLGPSTPSNMLNQMNLGIQSKSNDQLNDIQVNVNSQNNPIEWSASFIEQIGSFPPVQSKYGEVSVSNSIQNSFNQKIGRIPTQDPLLMFSTLGNQKYGVFYGEGIWRWKIYEFAKNKSNILFDEFIHKSVAFLLTAKNGSALRIKFPERIFKNEEIKLHAEYYNETMDLTTKPLIQFELINLKKKKFTYQFAVEENHYNLSLGKLPIGTYKWSAKSNYQGKKTTKNGNFFIEDYSLESTDTKSNFSLLREISNASHGTFLPLKNHVNLLKQIESNSEFVDVSFEEKENHHLLDYAWVLSIILMISTIEWFIRRWFGGY
jgi:hypothetical protein